MQRINRDAVVAVALLVVCGIFFWASFDIRQPDYGVLLPTTWPRIIIGVMAFLSLIYLVQSLSQGAAAREGAAMPSERERGVLGWLTHWRNPLICFGMFLAYLVVLPYLGMLLAGISFVFLLLTLLGGWAPRQLALHAAVAVVAIGSMWSLFTFGLGVLLPSGELFGAF